MPLLILILFLTSCLKHPRNSEETWTPVSAEAQIQTELESPIFNEEFVCDPWWDRIHDCVLKGYIEKALAINPKSLMADAKVRLTKAEALFYGAKMLPEVRFNIDATNQRLSKNGIFGLFPGVPFNFKQYESNFEFKYEFDFWEKNQNRMRAAIGEHEAAWAERAQARLVLSISVADAYWQYLMLEQRDHAYTQIVEKYDQMIELQRRLKAANISSNLQILPLEIQKEAYVAGLHKVRQNKEAARFKLQALVNPNFDEPIVTKELQVEEYVPLPVPRNIGLDLLHRRPDLTALKWKVEARDRERLSAQAEFFPNIDFAGLVGLQTINPQKLLRGDSLYGQWGPAIHLPIFTGGAISANYLAKDEQTFLAILEYEQGVVDAIEETLTSLKVTQELNERYQANVRRLQEAKKMVELIKARLKSNLNSSLDVLQSEVEALRATDEKLKIEALYFRSLLDVIRSVGGNYHEES